MQIIQTPVFRYFFELAFSDMPKGGVYLCNSPGKKSGLVHKGGGSLKSRLEMNPSLTDECSLEFYF